MRKFVTGLLAGLIVATSVTSLAQISGPTTRTPRLTVSPGPTSVEDLTVNGTCTGCGAGGGAVFGGIIDVDATPTGIGLPAGFSVNAAGECDDGGDYIPGCVQIVHPVLTNTVTIATAVSDGLVPPSCSIATVRTPSSTVTAIFLLDNSGNACAGTNRVLFMMMAAGP